MKYPNPCCRCGFCCLSETCPTGQEIHKIEKYGRTCPALYFNGTQAGCTLAGVYVSVGDGCCIKARAFKDGKQYDFASLPPELKKRAAFDLRNRIEREKVMAKLLQHSFTIAEWEEKQNA